MPRAGYNEAMTASITGRLQGNIVTLDTSVPPLDGQLVRVVLEPLVGDAELTLAPEAQARLWQQWVDLGPQGPLEEGDGEDFPESS
jgi:hypothetical protein